MKGLDTNVLVRLLVADDAGQANRALRYVGRECTAERPCLINRVVLCELVWVLEGAYGFGRDEISAAMEKVLRTAEFAVEDAEAAWAGVHAYGRQRADYADAVIAFSNQAQGCERTATFDRRAGRLDGFEAI